MHQTLGTEEVRSFYDHLGSRLDLHGFYENPALDLLVKNGRFKNASAVFEFGCGTGRFAEKLFSSTLPQGCVYVGVDLSPVMVDTARKRLAGWPERAHVVLTDGSVRLDERDNSYDHFVATYVIDILGERETEGLIREAHRVLRPNGLLCLVSLTHGATLLSRAVTSVWQSAFNISPRLVGGCRPVELKRLLSDGMWRIEFEKTVTAFGVTSEVTVASRAESVRVKPYGTEASS